MSNEVVKIVMHEIHQPRLLLGETYTQEDLHQREYCLPLEVAAGSFLKDVDRRLKYASGSEYNPAKSMDITCDDFGKGLTNVFEVLAYYDEGRVPCYAMDTLVERVEQWLKQVREREKGNPQAERLVDEVLHAFKLSHLIWQISLPKPNKTREIYTWLLFDSKRAIEAAFEEARDFFVSQHFGLTGDNVKQKAQKKVLPKTTEQQLKEDDRQAVLNAIQGYVDRGKSVRKAIQLCRAGQYKARMEGVSDESWRIYYTAYRKLKRLGGAVIKNVEHSGDSNYEELIKVIKENSKVTYEELSAIVGRSRDWVYRAIKRLQDEGVLVRRGSKKSGRWEVIENKV